MAPQGLAQLLQLAHARSQRPITPLVKIGFHLRVALQPIRPTSHEISPAATRSTSHGRRIIWAGGFNLIP
jgi:hypothetical protein